MVCLLPLLFTMPRNYSVFFSVLLPMMISCWSVAYAQDTITYQVGILGGMSTQRYQPHWSTANRFGILDDTEGRVSLLSVRAATKHRFSSRWSIALGIEGVGKVSSQPNDLWLQQAYVALRYAAFELSGGRVEETIGSQHPTLSSGSLGVSGNARPIPRIMLAIPTYTDVPFTRGYVQVKGNYVHGWLGKERYVANAYLHEKSVYARAGGKLPVNLYGGLVHFAIWGGETSTVKIPSQFKDYLRIITGSSAIADGPNDPLIGEAANAAGDHLGFYDLGAHVSLQNFAVQVYQQTPFEDASGNNPFNGDRLLGVSITTKHSAIITGFLYEYLHTTYQSGPGLTDPANRDWYDLGPNYGYRYGGRDNYYDNYLYKTGWVYQDRIIGTPLFFTKSRAKRYIEGFADPDERGFDFNVVNNRVIAHHVGIEGNVSSVQYRLLGTFTRNYGTYGGINGGITRWGSIENPELEYAFKPARRQAYFMLEVTTHPFSSQWSLLTSLAWDTGQLTDNAGFLVGLRREGLFTLRRNQPGQP